jgi:hypothetical protein
MGAVKGGILLPMIVESIAKVGMNAMNDIITNR